jgi:hypothetical protein
LEDGLLHEMQVIGWNGVSKLEEPLTGSSFETELTQPVGKLQYLLL